MIRLSVSAVAALLVLGACATESGPSVRETGENASAATEMAGFELAMKTVADLRASGNSQAAIQRLLQLAGDTTLTESERAEALFQLGELSIGPGGYDAIGAVGFFEEIVRDYGATDWREAAVVKLDQARDVVNALSTTVDDPSATRTDKFNALMSLGRHQDAIDLMVASDLSPGNDALLAMFQIGYLCEDSNLTGRSYDVSDRDGTVRKLRFCDFGK